MSSIYYALAVDLGVDDIVFLFWIDGEGYS